jgi:hypothetical protein
LQKIKPHCEREFRGKMAGVMSNYPTEKQTEMLLELNERLTESDGKK